MKSSIWAKSNTWAVSRPIFFVGMPRSGTTLLFAAFATHSQLAWFSQYMHRFPRLSSLAALSRVIDVFPNTRRTVPRHGEKRSQIERLKIMPAEDAGRNYGIWGHIFGEKFRFEYLLGQEPTETEIAAMQSKVSRALALQRKERFTAKITGPARIGYLSGVFDDAIFVHVIRDSRAVVDSLMRVPFWKEEGRHHELAWKGGLRREDKACLRRFAGSPVALAAVQWRTVIERAREEGAQVGSNRYVEVRYEDFVADPHAVLDEIFEFCNLPSDDAPKKFVDERVEVRNLNAGWQQRLSTEECQIIDEVTGTMMQSLGYGSDGPDGAGTRASYLLPADSA